MVSVIVPIYKVEAYLEKCIKSIQNQTYTDLEIILVDDGSPDGCGAICDRYAEADKRIRVIHKENGGLSDARNCGLDAATGEFIAFVDSDDFIHPQMVEILLHNAVQKEADIAVCLFKEVTENEKVSFTRYSPDDIAEDASAEVFEGAAVMNNLQHKNLLTVVAWNKLYRAELFKKLRYPKGYLHEDEFLVHQILYLCHRSVYVGKELYYYLQRAGSIMGEIKYANVKDGWLAYKERLGFVLKNGYPEMALYTKLHMLHYICRLYGKMNQKEDAEALLKEWRTAFAELYQQESVRSALTKEQKQLYKYFVIRPQLYYYKKRQAELIAECVHKIKRLRQILKGNG